MSITSDIASHHRLVIRDVCAEGWTLAYPGWVRETFTTALKTQTLPPYAVTRVESAVRAAVKINDRLNKQVDIKPTEVGNKKNVNARKADKRARDREIRMAMKGTATGRK